MVSLAGAGAVAAITGLPAVRREPLHVDEAVTLEFAPESLPTIVEDVFVERGGAPLFFFVEHVTLWWPGGLTGLRLPVFLFFLAALGLSYFVARDLCDRRTALLVPPLLAAAPLAVRLATFARMYTLFLAAVLLAVWLLLRAESGGGRRRWIAAGALGGALVYVHPIAPLYVAVAYATAFLRSAESAGEFLHRARPALAASALVALPYAYALAVLGNRYDVGSAQSRVFQTAAGQAVPIEGLLALTSRAWLGAAVLAVLALVGLAATVRRAPRIGLALALWALVPVGFFSVIPSETSFFPRYLLPALPFVLILVARGCLEVGRLGRRPLPIAAAVVAAVVVWETSGSLARLERLGDLRLARLTRTIDEGGNAVVFSSTGSAVAGRPAELVDAYVALELPDAGRLEELPGSGPGHEADVQALGAGAVRDFIAAGGAPARGVWIFTGSPGRLDRAQPRLQAEADVEALRISPRILVVRSRRALEARPLVEQAVRVRSAWIGGNDRDRWSRTLIAIDRSGLGSR
jgi:hypothetical protein